MEVMHVIKRDGTKETVSFDKVSNRLNKLVQGDGNQKTLKVDYISLAQKVCGDMYSGVHTYELDELSAQTCAGLITECVDYGILASRLAISNHHKRTSPSFSETIQNLYESTNKLGKRVQLVTKDLYNTVMKHKVKLNQIIDYSRDYNIDYFGFKTLEKSYLLKVNGEIVERPQHMFLRVSLGIHGSDIKSAIQCYNALSLKKCIHATPTLFNSGTVNGQLASCFLMGINSDSISAIYDALKDTALISKNSGGIGIHIHDIRARGSEIAGGTGISNGIVPMLRVFNNTARYVDQCVTPNTYIYTTDGPLAIQDVVEGNTQIYNSTGNIETIKKVLEHPYNGTVYNINTMHCIDSLKVTGEHPVFVLSNQKKGVNYDVIKNRLDKKLIKMEWKEVKDLNEDDMMIYSIPKYEKDDSSLSEKDCYIYGVILGDGSLSNDKDYGYISLNHTTKQHILEKCEEYFQNNYTEYSIEESKDNSDSVRIRWNKSNTLPFRYSDIYDSNKEKHISKRWIHLPTKKIQYILKGLIDTDGCNGEKELTFDTTSRQLCECFRFILLRMGIPSSGYTRDRIGESHETKRGTITNRKLSYCIRVPRIELITKLIDTKNDGQFFKFFTYKDDSGSSFVMSRIKSITEESYSGTLYDLQMEKTHDYMLHQGLVHNGGGKRNGSFAIYLEPWHLDIHEFLQLRKNQGFEEQRARDLFYAMWIPDLFMKRVQEDAIWTLMCPHECPGLSDVYGDDFEELYTKYENMGLGKQVKAQEIWFSILESQTETGTPYILFKDSCNKKSNQKNLGTIKSSNLCCEIVEHTSKDETAVCNLASISLPSCVIKPNVPDKIRITGIPKCPYCYLAKAWCDRWKLDYVYDQLPAPEVGQKYPQIHVQEWSGGFTDFAEKFPVNYDYEELANITKQLTRNLNRVIDKSTYPIESARRSNIRHRPIGIGVQGLADVFMIMRIGFDSERAKFLNDKIFETIYYAAVQESMTMAQKKAEKKKTNNNTSNFPGAYSSFEGSPLQNGQFQFDLWGVTPSQEEPKYDWDSLRKDVMTHGVMNSLLVAPMPTASTAQILGNNECFEPITSNIYVRRTLAGEFVLMNKYLQEDLESLHIWNNDLKNSILEYDGSVQHLKIPQIIKDTYKTVWEISQRVLIDLAADRGKFICQSQSLNLFVKEAKFNVITSMLFHAWKVGLKTGVYYLRTRPQSKAQSFTIAPKEEPVCESCSG